MFGLDAWEVALLVIAGYVGIMALVRMMRRRRDEVLSELQREVERERMSEQRRRR